MLLTCCLWISLLKDKIHYKLSLVNIQQIFYNQKLSDLLCWHTLGHRTNRDKNGVCLYWITCITGVWLINQNKIKRQHDSCWLVLICVLFVTYKWLYSLDSVSSSICKRHVYAGKLPLIATADLQHFHTFLKYILHNFRIRDLPDIGVFIWSGICLLSWNFNKSIELVIWSQIAFIYLTSTAFCKLQYSRWLFAPKKCVFNPSIIAEAEKGVKEYEISNDPSLLTSVFAFRTISCV